MSVDKAKEAILTNISDGLSVEGVKILAEAYAMLVNAETQEKMTEWQTRDCNCPQCRDGLDDEVIR